MQNIAVKLPRMSELEVESQEKSEEVKPKTTLQQLQESKARVSWMKEELNKPNSVMRNIYSTDSAKKNFIVTWAEELEMQHRFESKLEIEYQIKSVGMISSFIKSEMHSMGLHKSSLHYVHEVLGVKYKYEKYDHTKSGDGEGGDEPLLNSSNTIAVDFETENASFIETINQQMDFLHHLKDKAKSSRILSILTPEERLKYEETNLRTQATILFAAQVIDDRQSVPMNAQLKLVMAIVAATNNSAAGMYVSKVKQHGANKALESEDFFKRASNIILQIFSEKRRKLFKDTFKNINHLRAIIQKVLEKNKTKSTIQNPADVMTSKQAMKILYGLIKNVIPIFDHKDVEGHHDRDAALMDGFYGLHCPECGSLRVVEKEHPGSHEWLCFCYHCEWWFEAKTVSKCWNCHIPLFDDILDVILKTAVDMTNQKGEPIGAKQSQCPRCEKPLTLPAKMFQAPKLRGK